MRYTAKKFIALLCALSMLLSTMIVVHASGIQLEVGNKTIIQGVGTERVEVPLVLSNNPGILGMTLQVTYTEGLTLTNISLGDALSRLAYTPPGNYNENPFTLLWDGLADVDSSNGTIAILRFDVPKDEIKTYSITVTPNGVFDSNVTDIGLSVTNCAISLTERPKENFSGLSIADSTYTYDGTEKALAVSGVPTGATVTYTSADFDVNGKAIDAGTYNIKATVKKDGYNDWSDEATLTINPKTISVTGITVSNKVYDGTDEATLSGGTISGLVARDSADQYCEEHQGYRIKYYIPEIGTFADANVGTNKAVEIAEIELTGCSADNYVLTQPTGLKANITKAPITVKAKYVTIKTGTTIPAFDENSYEITSGELFGNDKITGTLATNCTSTSVAKDFNITQGTLTAGNNYNLTFVAGKLSVVDKTVQNVVVDGVVTEKTYGDDGFKITVTPDVNSNLDNFTITSSNTNVATIDVSGNVTINNAGTTTIFVKEAGNAEYAPFEKTWTLTVKKLPLTVTADNKTKKVGQEDPQLTHKLTGELVGYDTIEVTLVREQGETIGRYAITKKKIVVSDNYDVTFNPGVFEIVDKTPQVITVDGVVEKKTYGDDGFKITVIPDATSKLDNFTIASSDANVATVDASGNVTIKGAGITTLSVKEAGNDEYAAFEKTWKLTVDKAKVTITADNITKKIGQNDPELTYSINGNLYGEDKVSGELTRTSGELVGKYDILIGTLAINNNYEITFNKGIFEIVEKTPQIISVADIDAKTYGSEPFKLEVTPDVISKLNTFTYASSNADVADVAADGTVTIKGAGETTITVSQAGNDEYAATEKSVKVIVNPITVAVTAIDMDNKTATLEGILEADVAGVELDFDNIKTTVISSEKSTIEETTTITSTLKVTNFTLKGEKAKNYATDKTAFLTTTVATTTVAEKLTEDENVTIEAAPVNDKTIIVTDVAVVPEAEVKKVTIDVTAIADTKVNTVAIPKATVDTIIGIDAEASLEITLKDGSAENKETTITLNAQALASIQAAGSAATTLSISVDKTEKEELATEQAAKFDEVSTKTPVVYSLNIVDEAGNSVASSFGDAGIATVKLPYAKPAGNGNVIVKYLDDLGNLTNISNPKYDATTQTVTVELGHFSEYLIYTEPVVSYGGGGGVATYTVKFETNGGSAVKAITVNKNAVAAEPTVPTKEGFKFDGWYTDKELTTAYDFTAKVTKNFTLYAKWTEIEKEPEEDKTEISMTFTDVKSTDWFFDSVKYVADNKLMNGVSETEFAPDNTLTRSMLVTVLYRNAGEPATSRSIPFADIDMGAYYANAVSWAKQNGIVNGVTENEFAPDANITREQIAAIMFRYAQYKGMETVTSEENLHFADSSEISEYAVSAMNWAVGTGLMKGKSTTTINPKDNATRAEIAAILQRFIEANK